MTLRAPTINELQFLEFMIREAKLQLPNNWKEKLKVSSMDEGNMGSLLLFPDGINVPRREFGHTVFEHNFKDKDRKEVVVALNVDRQDKLFELDVWKVTFDPLVEFPVMK
jgi:hypothetical protein